MELDIRLWPKQGEALSILSDPKIQTLGYGGAMGGGKSHLVRQYCLLRALTYKKSSALIIRKSFPELERNHIKRFRMDYPRGLFNYVERRHLIEINGSTIELGFCESPKDLGKFQGAEYDTICIDECQFHVKDIYSYLQSRLRKARADSMQPKMLLTFNPGGIGNFWLRKLFIEQQYEPEEDPSKFAFLRAKVYDNPSLMQNDPDYVKRLESLPERQRKAFLDGDFYVFEGQFFGEFGKHLRVQPMEIPERLSFTRLFGSLDIGVGHATSFGLWFIDEDGTLIRLFTYLAHLSSSRDHAMAIRDAIKSFRWTKGFFPITIWASPDAWTKAKLSDLVYRAPIDEYMDVFRGERTGFEKANNERENGCMIMSDVIRVRDGRSQLAYFDKYNTLFEEYLPAVYTDPNRPEQYEKTDTDADDLVDEVRYGIVGCYTWQATQRSTQLARKDDSGYNEQIARTDWYNL